MIQEEGGLREIILGTGSVYVAIVDLGRVWIMLDAYESENLSAIRKGDSMSISLPPGIPGQVFEASIGYIDPVLDPDTGL